MIVMGVIHKPLGQYRGGGIQMTILCKNPNLLKVTSDHEGGGGQIQ